MVEDKTVMKKIEITTSFDSDIRVIKTDKKRLTQVLLNLVNNALKFTPREGDIQIGIENVSDDLDNLTHLRVSVTDSGIGIKDEDKQKLFKLFGMLKEKGNT